MADTAPVVAPVVAAATPAAAEPTVAAAPAAVVATEPAAVAAPAVADKPKVTESRAKAKAVEALKALSKPKEETKPEPAKAEPAKVEIAQDPETHKQLTKLLKEKQELQKRVTASEQSSKDAATLIEARQLWKAGKKLEALAKMSETDGTEAMSELLLTHLDTPQSKPEEVLTSKVEALQKRLDDEAKAKNDASSAAAAKAQYDAAVTFADGLLTTIADKHVIASRPENRQEAAAKALEKAAKIATDEGLTPEDMTPELSKSLVLKAYGEVEAEYEALGKRYSKPAPAPLPHSTGTANPDTSQASPQTRPNQVRAAVETKANKPVRTLADAQEKAREAARQALGR